MASPRISPRPARPATCVSNWNVRSAARKSATPSPMSADTTPTSVTCGKSWPLAIICVPTSTSISRAANRARTAPIAPRRCIVSRSTRATRAPGQRRAAPPARRARSRRRCTRGTRPCRTDTSPAAAPCGRSSGTAPAPARRCTVSVTAQLGHSAVLPHPRHSSDGAYPRRFRSTMACSRRARHACSASRSGWLQDDVGALLREHVAHVHDPHVGERTVVDALRACGRSRYVPRTHAATSRATAWPSPGRPARRASRARTIATSRPW